MNLQPFAHTAVCLLLVAFAAQAQAQRFTILTPDTDSRGTFEVADPDRLVRTLGKPEIQFDLAASHDTLLDLRIRRAGLKLPNGKTATAFAGDKEANLVIVAGAPVAHISIAGVTPLPGAARSEREALVLFRAADGTLLAPAADEVAVFDTGFNRLPFAYSPAAIPTRTLLPVTLLLDMSGSMAGHMKDVVNAATSFMASLPLTARCRIVLFNDRIEEFGPQPPNAQVCATAGFAFWKPMPEPSGGTALLAALNHGLRSPPETMGPRLQPITLVITDGVDTGAADPAAELRRLAALKAASGGKLFVFWAGASDPALLANIADLQIAAGSDVKGELERFFRSLGVSLSGLQALRVGGP
ncbi:MAG: VWA domain-containing protein [Alphaproteobacteria bacterium]|nr:VWA domain-containing protein [Alphaproteobacteria bacterium]